MKLGYCRFGIALAAAILQASPAVYGGPPMSVELMTQSLISLCLRYQNAPAAEQGNLLNELLRVASDREKELAKLMDSDPEEVLRVAIPQSLRASMPPAVQAFVEEHVELEGAALVLHQGRDVGSRYLYFLQVGGKHFSLHFASEPPADFLTGSQVRIKAVRIGKDIAL